MDLLPLFLFAFLAGFIDSVVGGGGLIQVPALFIFMPGAEAATVFGTNKLAGIAGTSLSLQRYMQHVQIKWRAVLPAAIAAFVFSFLGARVVSHLDTALLKPVILLLLVLVAVYTFVRKDFGSLHAPRLTEQKELLYGIAAGMAIGFYDGFFGPGAGSFLIFVFIGLFGFSFLAASASAKAVNVATNLSAVVYFAATGHIVYKVAVPLAMCNMLGSYAGSRMAILKGSRFIRVFFLVVVAAMIVRFAADIFDVWPW